MSLLIREGTRNHQHVEEDPGLAQEIIFKLDKDVTIHEGHRVECGDIYNQAHLGSSRLPMRHFLLERRS